MRGDEVGWLVEVSTSEHFKDVQHASTPSRLEEAVRQRLPCKPTWFCPTRGYGREKRKWSLAEDRMT